MDSGTPKFWWQSRAVWGGVVSIGVGVASLFGRVIDADAQTTLTDLAVNGAVVAGGLLAVFGRLRAKSPIARQRRSNKREES